MRQSVLTLLVCLLVVAAAGSASGVASVSSVDGNGSVPDTVPDGTANDTTVNDTTANGTTSDTIAPGERLSGVIGVQSANLKGDLESRTFGQRVARAATADAKAEIVSAQFEESRTRSERLADRLARLKEARQNGTISEGQYAARVAETRAELNAVETVANRTANVSEGLPAETLRANGVNATAIRTLQRHAAELSGPEVARVARTITGPDPERGHVPVNATNRRNRTTQSTGVGTVASGRNRTTTPANNGTMPVRNRTNAVAGDQTATTVHNQTNAVAGTGTATTARNRADPVASDQTATAARNRTHTPTGTGTATVARNRTNTTADDRTTGAPRSDPVRGPTADGGERRTAGASAV